MVMRTATENGRPHLPLARHLRVIQTSLCNIQKGRFRIK
jgi:hypothetical protein